MRSRTSTAIATPVAWRPSVRERSASPITRSKREMSASTRARRLYLEAFCQAIRPRSAMHKGRLGWQKAVCTAPGTLDNRLPYAARLKACPNQAARVASGLRWPFFSISHSAL